MKKLGLIVAAVLLAGCSEPTPSTTPGITLPGPNAPLPQLTSEQIAALQAKLRAIDPAAAENSFDKAQAVCRQIADGAHGDGFLRGGATRFDTAPSNGQAIVDAITGAGVCG
jgi:RecB family exonuclease